jgi:Tfp pilus assembly protein PilN
MKEELEALKKRSRLISIVCGISIALTLLFVYIQATKAAKKSENEIILEQEVIHLKNEVREKTEQNKKHSDSLAIYYSGIDKANQRTNNSINKILKQNEKNKENLRFIGNLDKLRIVDSILRANGIRPDTTTKN